MVFHTEQQLTHAALRSALDGLAFIATGGAVAFWHLRQARARAGFSVEEVFWGDALYSHLVALLALIVGMVGSVMVLLDLASIAAPVCVSGGTLAGGYGTFCLSSTKADAIGIVDGLIILAIAGGVWLWHVRRGRAIMRPASAA